MSDNVVPINSEKSEEKKIKLEEVEFLRLAKAQTDLMNIKFQAEKVMSDLTAKINELGAEMEKKYGISLQGKSIDPVTFEVK